MSSLGADARSSAPAPEFYCAEIWGGNRAINGPIELPGVHGWVYSHPCEGGRGGDIHYVSLCSSGLISRFCLADVAGHGEPVARVSGEIHRLLRRYMNNLDQRRVLSELNRRLEAAELGTMTTAVALTYFPPMHRLSVSYAGHPPGWFFQHKTNRWTRLTAADRPPSRAVLRDLPLAISPDVSFSRRTERVRQADRVLLVTDGVLEAPDPSGNLFGDERMQSLLDANVSAGVKRLTEIIVAALRAHTRAEDLSHDDVTLLVLEFTPGPRAWGIWHGLKRRLFPRRPAAMGL